MIGPVVLHFFTTYLQQEVFPKSDGINFMGKTKRLAIQIPD